MEFLDYARLLRRHAALILLVAILGGGAGLAYASRQTPLYESRSTVLVSVQSSNIGDASTGASYAQQLVTTYAQVAQKPFVLNRVIAALGLRTTPADLADQVDVLADTDATLMTVTVTDASAERAARIANAISKQLGRTVDAVTPTPAGEAVPVRLTVVEGARPADAPVSPNRALIIAIGVLGGAALAIAVAIVRTALDTRVRRVEDVEAATGSTVLGRVARTSAVRRHPLIVRHDPYGRVAEALRTVRTNLQFVESDRPSQSILVSSAVAGEGKSTTAVNLALTIADAGARVVVVDADLRRSRLARTMRVETSPGLADVLADRATIEQALRPWGDGALTVLPAGAAPTNPTELLQSGAMARLLRGLESRFDAVIIDAPPLLPVSDAAILGTRVAGTILVAALGSADRGQLREAVYRVRRADGRVLGVVVTKVPVAGAEAAAYAKDRRRPKRTPRPARPQRDGGRALRSRDA